MARVSNARSSHVERWVVPAAREILIREACKGAPTRFLDEIAFLEMGQSPVGESVNEDGDGTPFIGGPSDLGIEFPNTNRFTTSPNKLCRQDDIIVCVRATIGEPRWSDGVYALGRGVAGIRPKNSDIDRKFLFRIIQANERLLYEQGTGTTFKTITKDHLAKIIIPILPPKTQKAIGDFLAWLESHILESPDFSTAPALPEFLKSKIITIKKIEALTARISKAQSLREEAIAEAKVLLQSRVNQILEEKSGKGTWKWAFLPDFVSSGRQAIKRGPFGSHLRKEFFVENGYKIYEQKHAIHGDFNAGRYFIDEEKFQQLKSFEVKPGDIIISCSGTIGKVAIIPETAMLGIINQALLKLTLDTNKIDRRFFKIVFESDFIKQEVAAMSLGSAMKNIGSVKILKKIKFPLPPLDEQRRIVAYLDSVQVRLASLRELQSQTGKELSALLPSVLDKAFKGEL